MKGIKGCQDRALKTHLVSSWLEALREMFEDFSMILMSEFNVTEVLAFEGEGRIG